MITKPQIKKIHSLKNILNVQDDAYREILSFFDAKSCKDLSFKKAEKLIEQLQIVAIDSGVWLQPNHRYNELENRVDMASPKQLRMLEAKWAEVLQSYSDTQNVEYKRDYGYVKSSLRRFLQKQFKISDVRFLKKDMVSKVLKAVNSIHKRNLISK